MNTKTLLVLAFSGLLWVPGSIVASAQDGEAVSTRYKALECPSPLSGLTWAILDRDGAYRQVTPYLSSLGQGEAGIGVITSPPFHIASDTITFTICGHDGMTGGEDKNYIALVDARKGNVLFKTPPPQNDAMQDRSWDVKRLRGIEARIEIHDNATGSGFAWMGIGRIDAGDAFSIDFANGMPTGWEQAEKERVQQVEYVYGPVPFQRDANAFTLVPTEGSVEIPCGFVAKRLFFLGCTVNDFKPTETYGGIEIHYREGSPEIFPLMCGYTLDGRFKTLSPSKASYLHSSGDPYQYILAIAPRDGVIDRIRLVAEPDRFPVPRISAITCETSEDAPNLLILPAESSSGAFETWLDSHTVTANSPSLSKIMTQVRSAHRMSEVDDYSSPAFIKHPIDPDFRSEGVAIADFNGDKLLDIAVGPAYYAAPDWRPIQLLPDSQIYNLYGYSASFLCFADDLNDDGAMDLIVVGFPGQQTHWLENPGKDGGEWKQHLVLAETGGESPDYVDINGDGQRELICINKGRYVIARPGEDITAPWAVTPFSKEGDPTPGHGLGVGDINSDGQADILIPGGWWEDPGDGKTFPWPFHSADIYGEAQLCVYDFDADGDNDVLGSSSHGYGIKWSEQTPDGWVTHDIDDTYSQTHALHLADINGDGLMDFVTGKRFWAHNGHDKGSFQPALLCWYERQGGEGEPAWTKHVIDTESGVGLHFKIVDINGDGHLDIVTSNKKGVFYFEKLSALPYID